MSVDQRTRRDGRPVDLTIDQIFDDVLPLAFASQADLLAAGVLFLAPKPMAIEVGHRHVGLVADDQGRVRVVDTGALPAGRRAHLRLTEEQLLDLVEDQSTPMGYFSSGQLDMPEGCLDDFQNWWVVVRGALDGRAPYTPGSLELLDRDGTPLDIYQAFSPDTDDAVLAHFLHEAGFLHLKGLFTADEMQTISADMDRAAPSYSEGDKNSWWAGTADGTRHLVRMQGFQDHSPTTAAILDGDRLARIGSLTGDGHAPRPAKSVRNRIEALMKPVGVVEGISDVPWHKDCSLGRHSYECCGLTVGISVTGADASAGQLKVVAGSHRALVWAALVQPGVDLPIVAVPTETGDVTVHLSCTLHMAQPPETRPRRVLYTGLRLPEIDAEAAAVARVKLGKVREAAPLTVNQPRGVVI